MAKSATGKGYHYNGRVVGVHQGRVRGGYVAAWRSDKGPLHRVISLYLPECETAEECQKNLDAWALKKGLEEAGDGGLSKKKAEPGREIPPGGLVEDNLYSLRSRDKAEEPKVAHYIGFDEKGRHVFLIRNEGTVMTEKFISPSALHHYEVRAYAS